MVKYRNIKVKIRGGGSRIQRAMVLASGKLRFVKNITRSRSTARPSRVSHNIRRKTHMARKRRSHRSPGTNVMNFAQKVTKIFSLVAPAYYEGMKYPTNSERLIGGIGSMAGYNLSARKFDLALGVRQWTPFIAVSVGIPIIKKVSGMIRGL